MIRDFELSRNSDYPCSDKAGPTCCLAKQEGNALCVLSETPNNHVVSVASHLIHTCVIQIGSLRSATQTEQNLSDVVPSPQRTNKSARIKNKFVLLEGIKLKLDVGQLPRQGA